MPVSLTPLPLADSSSNTYTSVLGREGDNARLEEPPAAVPASRSRNPGAHKGNQPSGPTSDSRRGSFKSESAESSPTTTISTLDSTLTEPSPSSSPESPTGLVPLTTFTSLSKSSNSTFTAHQAMDRKLPGLPSPGSIGFDTIESPTKKGRNVKSLFINTNGISATRPQTAPGLSKHMTSETDPLPPVPPTSTVPKVAGGIGADRTAGPSYALSEPTSPSFIMPNVPKPRRSKLNLTISTGESSSGSSGGIPATPAFAPPPKVQALGGFSNLSAMREDEETLFSPSGAPQGGMKLPPFCRAFDPALPTPSHAPEGGMTLPSFGGYPDYTAQRPTSRPALSMPQKNFEGGAGSSVVNHTIEHHSQTPAHELPLSQEVKSPSYPSGPACIYAPNVFLYHAPTCEEARQFDVIINVAREIPNPFEVERAAEDVRKAAKGYTDTSVQCELLTGPPLNLAFKQSQPTTNDFEQADDEPMTPKASTPRLPRMPEYHHLPWEHNSNVYNELLEICELIDQKATKGKKVLIHCQLGVSRSASLIVAYGLYKNPSLSPDEAREKAKEKSRWIDLNMHFMYELGDFKKILAERFGEHYAPRRAAGPAPGLVRAKTEFIGTTYQSEDYPNRSNSIVQGITEGGTEDYRQGPVSAFPGASTLPFGRDAAPLPKPTRILGELPFRGANPTASSESESSDATTPVQSESNLERSIPKRTKTNDSDKTVKLITRHAPEESMTPPVPQGILSPTTSSFSIQVAPEHTTPAKVILPPTIANDSPQIPDPTPPRRLRPMPSLPAGFSSLQRNVTPNLVLDTKRLVPNPGTLKSPPPPSSHYAEDGDQGQPPQIPDLDFGNSLLMSPRTTEFGVNPFHRSRNSLAGDLAGIDFLASPTGQMKDPRSPPIPGETAITRNIDDVL